MEAFIEQRKRASPKRTDLLAGKASGPMASLEPNETQRPKELPATRRQVAPNKSPFVGTSFCQNRPGSHPTCSIRRRPKGIPDRASRASNSQAGTFARPGPSG